MQKKIYELFDLPIDDSLNILHLKEFLIQKLKEMYPTLDISIEKIRIRERNGEKLSKVMLDTDNMNFYAMYDRKNLCIEVLDKKDEPNITSSDMIILAKRWWPSTWQISECKEFTVKKYSNIDELGNKLAKEFDINVLFT